jgi:hypothetical protein
MQYLLLIHRNTDTQPSTEEWNAFFARAQASGWFRGGSEIGRRELIGASDRSHETDHVAGFMRFDADDRDALLGLLRTHPVVIHRGTIELCDMPKS